MLNSAIDETACSSGVNPFTSDDGEKKTVPPPWTRPKAIDHVSHQFLGRISEVMILDSQCSVLVHKRSLQNLPHRKAQQLFAKHLKTIGPKNLDPYFRDEDIDFFYLSKNDVYFVAAHPSPESDPDSPVAIVVYLDFLQRLYEVLKDCIGTVNEPYVAVNRMLVFELLDEMITVGYGFVSSFNEIKPHLTLSPIRPKIPQQDDLATRFFGINSADKGRSQASASKPKDKAPNSAYINIVEGLSAVLGPDGELRSSELWGKLSLISTLDRPAPVTIQLNPELVIKSPESPQGPVAGAIHIENPSFHACVDTQNMQRQKVLRVLPPPDQTRLMVYTLSDSSCIRIPIILIPTLSAIDGSKDQNLTLRLINQAESHTVASYIRVKVKFPQCVSSISTTKSGDRQTSQFNSAEKMVEWEVKKSRGGSEENINFRLIRQSDRVLSLDEVGPISVAFNLTHFSASGLVVSSARVEGATSDPGSVGTAHPECFFGVSTRAASYTVRTDSPRKGQLSS